MRTAAFLSAVVIAALAGPAARAAVDDNAASVVTELVTTALGKDPRLEVLSSADVRRQLELEANKQAVGCDDRGASCLAEVAGAMGAQLVVSGQLGQLDDVIILTLNLFDSAQGRAVGRVAVQETSLKALSARVDGAVQELTAPFVQKLAPGATTRVLVLDIAAPKGESSSSSPSPVGATVEGPPPDPVFIGGLAGLGVGVIVAGIGAALYAVAVDVDGQADDPGTDAVAAAALYDERDAWAGAGLTALGVGGAVAVAGGVLVGLAVSE